MKENLDKISIGLKIKQIRENNSLSQIAFSKELEVSQQTISQIEKGIIAPSLDILVRITSKYCISIDAILFDESIPKLSNDYSKKSIPKSIPNSIPKSVPKSVSNVPEEVQLLALLSDFGKPLIPIEAMAGFGTAEAAQVFENHITERYVIPDFKGKVDYFIRVTGSSMYPKYNSGDVVACKMIENLSFVQWNKTYVLDTSQGAIVKRLIKSSKSGYITCRSDNKDYPDFEVNINEDIHAIALIIGVIRFE